VIQTEPTPATAVSKEQPPNVLLFEGREELARLLKLHLERLGFRVLLATSPEETLKLWVENKKTLSMFLSDWSQTRGLTPRHLVALFSMVRPDVRMIDTGPYVNFTYPAGERPGHPRSVAAPRSLEAFNSVLLARTNPQADDATVAESAPSDQLVLTS
jgi:hypothetical protein